MSRVIYILTLLSIFLVWNQATKRSLSNPIRRFGASLLATLATLMSLLVFSMFITSKSLSEIQYGLGWVSFFASILLLVLTRKKITSEKVLPFRDRSFLSANRFHLLAIIIPSSLVLIFSFWTITKIGDQGWDSNAYHLPISGLLRFEGSNNFDPLLGLGTFTILTPYGAHSIAALVNILSGTPLFSSLITYFSVFGFICFAYGSILESKVVSRNSRLIFLLPVSVWLIPSVIGQTTHFYVDTVAGVFVASTFLMLSSFLRSKKHLEVDWLLTGVFGSAAISIKPQSLSPIALIMLVLYALAIKQRKIAAVFLITVPFIFLGVIPYVRNYIFFDNPFYPILFWNFPGRISIKELSASVESFAPSLWGETLPARVIFSSIISPLVVMVRVIGSRFGWNDINRSDLSGFSYDTVIGGTGATLALVLLFVIVLSLSRLIGVIKAKSLYKSIFLRYDLGLVLILLLITFFLVPGSWWVRYNMGVVLFIAYLVFMYLSGTMLRPKIQNAIIVSLLPVMVLQGLFLASYSLKYERVVSNATNQDFRPQYGLTQSKAFDSITCKRLVFVEPRPTFTAAYWNIGCSEYVWAKNPATFIFIAGDYAVFNKDTYMQFERSRLGLFDTKPVNAWFDPKGDWGSLLVFIKSID